MIMQNNIALFHVGAQRRNRGLIPPRRDNNRPDTAFGVDLPYKENFPSLRVENGPGHLIPDGGINAFGGFHTISKSLFQRRTLVKGEQNN
jgi:hypothetical protein